MIKDAIRSTSRLALFAAAGLFVSGTSLPQVLAADLGGDCCADLEERVAELEATAVTKSARQLSMTISGRIHSAFMHWDTGGDNIVNDANVRDYRASDSVFVGDWGAGSKVQIDGRGQINADWEVGYRVAIYLDGNDPNKQTTAGARSDTGVDPVGGELYAFIRSATIGAVSIGRRGEVQGGASKVDVSGKTSVANNVDPTTYGSNLALASSAFQGASAATLGQAFSVNDGDGGAGEVMSLRYDSPDIGGFILSAGWANLANGTDPIFGETLNDKDRYSVRLSYADQLGDLKIAGAAAYWTDSAHDSGDASEDSGILGSLGIMHVPTGLFANAGAGQISLGDNACQTLTLELDNTGVPTGNLAETQVGCGDPTFWYVTLGISQKVASFGATTLFGTYYSSSDNKGASIGAIPVRQNPASREIAADGYGSDYWSIGIVQDIDNANMQLFATYRTLSTGALVSTRDDQGFSTVTGVEDVNIIGVGALINF